MSTYYNINGLKVRVSDHEPNRAMDRMRGTNDIELYIKGLCNELLSVEEQLYYICDRRGLNLDDFKEVLNDWKDGSYNIDFFKSKEVESSEVVTIEQSARFNELRYGSTSKEVENYIKGYQFSATSGKDLYKEIKDLSEATGVSQSKIKQIKNLRGI